MPKPPPQALTLDDLNDYLSSDSDFGFEMAVLRELRAKHLKCEHSGHYEDPVTKKLREFDIRALYQAGPYRVRFAIECKNLRDFAPLLVSMVQRDLDEAYHEFTLVVGPPVDHRSYRPPGRAQHISNSRLYPSNGPVVKSTAQIRRTDSSFTSSDGDVYEKWGQALASATELVLRSARDVGSGDDDGNDYPILSAVIPCLVVPNDRLWGVEYDMNGGQIGEPRKVVRASQYVGKSYALDVQPAQSLTLSHLDIFTIDGLLEFIGTIVSDPTILFPYSALRQMQRDIDRRL
jgi:hypothetical protein